MCEDCKCRPAIVSELVRYLDMYGLFSRIVQKDVSSLSLGKTYVFYVHSISVKPAVFEHVPCFRYKRFL